MPVDKDLVEYLEGFLTLRRKGLFEKVVAQRTNFITVATEDVYQLHNTSAVMRSCDVFGIQNIHVIEERNLKKIDREIAMGAQKWVTLNRHHSSRNCIENLRNKGYQIIATTPSPRGGSLTNIDISRPSAIFFGTEKNGLSEEVIENADQLIQIPMYGFTESLNISVSAAIILQNVTQKLRNSKIIWELDENEKNAVKFEWLSRSFKNVDEMIKNFENNRRIK